MLFAMKDNSDKLREAFEIFSKFSLTTFYLFQRQTIETKNKYESYKFGNVINY